MIYHVGGSSVLHERGRRHFFSGSAPLSIKSFARGRAYYDVGHGRYAVDSESYLVLNSGRDYSLTIDSKVPLESFCLFFDDRLTAEVRHSLHTREDLLLDDPRPGGQTAEFVERTYPHDQHVSTRLFALRTALTDGNRDPAWLQERLVEILESLICAHSVTRREIDRLPATRPSTRDELYRRLHRARDFMAASLDCRLTLEEMAGVACLSINHFLRSFKQVFGKSPHQYLIDLRLQEARRLLAVGGLPVTEVCLAVGFESPGSFSRLFRERFGCPPSAVSRADEPA